MFCSVLQMNNLFYHKGSGNSLPFTAVTIYPLTTSEQFYLLHDLVSRVHLEHMMKETAVPIADQGQLQLKTGIPERSFAMILSRYSLL